ncbi:SCO6880 family protein [Brachybacterium alimentarium]|uniref:SCO6880 family protein n=1 Tax=Brachybacterium alimentarium TaxID=47845 RepID=UPI003FCF4DF6
MAAEATEDRRWTARFPRLSGRGLIMGLGKAQLVLVGIAFVCIIGAFMTQLWAFFGTLLVVSVALVPTWFTGRPMILWAPLLGQWFTRMARGQTKYRVRPLAPRPVGTLGLPGDAARLRVLVDDKTGAGLLHDPRSRTLTAIARVEPLDSFALAEGTQQDVVAGGWGSLLSSFCTDTSNGVSRVGVVLRAVSDGGEEINNWFHEKGNPDMSPAAYEAYRDYISVSRTDSIRHEAFVTITLNMKSHGVAALIREAGGGVAGGAEVLRTRMEFVRGQFTEAALRFNSWAGSDDVAVLARTAYDPDAQPELESHPEVGRSLAGAGPMALDESFTYFRTEAGYQRVLLVVEWPRKPTTAGFLQHLVVAQVRHTFALICEPIPTRKAMSQARRASTSAETSRQWENKSGAVDSVERKRERSALAQEEAALESGHGALNFAGLVSVSGNTLDELRVATEQVRTAASRSGCELRIIGGEQASAFIAAALPFGRGL